MNKMADRALISTMLEYSPKKKNTKIIPECSVKNPATSSDSFGPLPGSALPGLRAALRAARRTEKGGQDKEREL